MTRSIKVFCLALIIMLFTGTSLMAAETTYTVKSGDCLWAIAQKYGTSVETIKNDNQLNSSFLKIGTQLIINSTVVIPDNNVPTPSRAGNPLDGTRIIEKAQEYLGTPYRYGGQSPGGFDCSGFVRYIFAQFDINLPHNAAAQYGNGAEVGKPDLVAGDLVFFACGSSSIDHVGIYSGNDQFIHSSSPRSGGVIYSSLSSGYYSGNYVGGRRILR
ncbi:MAG: peptidoglycan endopeptidase [Syntrophomonadaceae bacterium]|nr:peptidoglycan endopeptidase [Syntrophomonadaceae bacterium]